MTLPPGQAFELRDAISTIAAQLRELTIGVRHVDHMLEALQDATVRAASVVATIADEEAT